MCSLSPAIRYTNYLEEFSCLAFLILFFLDLIQQLGLFFSFKLLISLHTDQLLALFFKLPKERKYQRHIYVLRKRQRRQPVNTSFWISWRALNCCSANHTLVCLRYCTKWKKERLQEGMKKRRHERSKARKNEGMIAQTNELWTKGGKNEQERGHAEKRVRGIKSYSTYFSSSVILRSLTSQSSDNSFTFAFCSFSSSCNFFILLSLLLSSICCFLRSFSNIEISSFLLLRSDVTWSVLLIFWGINNTIVTIKGAIGWKSEDNKGDGEINAHKGLLEQELEKHMLYSFTKGRWLKKKCKRLSFVDSYR